jgi:PAS domain S-box-containing protein
VIVVGRADSQMFESEAQFRSLVERIPAHIYTEAWEGDGAGEGANPRLYMSPQWEELIGVPPDEVLDDPDTWRRMLHPDDAERVIAADEETNRTGERFDETYRMVRPGDGEVVWVHDDAQLIRDERGRPLYWLGIMADITETKRAEEAQEKQQQLATLGTLTAGIAHEIKNPLNFVINFSQASAELTQSLAELIAEPNADPAEIRELTNELRRNAETIERQGQRALEIITGTLSLSRTKAPPRAPADLGELVEQYAQLAYHGLRGRGAGVPTPVEFELDPELPRVAVVEPELGRVVLNLVGNACEAIAASDRIGGADPAVTVSTRRADPWAEIRVRDTGPGIPPQVRERVFEPFFTTKDDDGTGLGLAISRDIVLRHDGEIELRSEPGETEFVVRLPLESPEQAPAPSTR